MAGPSERERPFDLPPVVVVLGCQPRWSPSGRLTGALARRLAGAHRAHEARPSWLIVSGGRTWGGVVEADAMRDDLVLAGVHPRWILRERCSLTTADNARLAAPLLRRLGDGGPVHLVTCDWHMPRASALFRREGLAIALVPVTSPATGPVTRWVRAGREWLSGLGVSGGTPA